MHKYPARGRILTRVCSTTDPKEAVQAATWSPTEQRSCAGQWVGGGLCPHCCEPCLCTFLWLQRQSDDDNQQQYFFSSAPNQDFLLLPGFVPMQLAIDKFILNRTSSTPMDSYVRACLSACLSACLPAFVFKREWKQRTRSWCWGPCPTCSVVDTDIVSSGHGYRF